MDNPLEIFLVIVIAALVLWLIGFWAYQITWRIWAYFFFMSEFLAIKYFGAKPLKPFGLHWRRLSPDLTYYLHDEYPFYRALSDKNKRKFEHRVRTFMKRKKFNALHGMDLTKRHKLLISAEAIKLSFGWWNYRLLSYHTIGVSPEAFYARINRNFNKGLTLGSGHIFFSWADFEQGLKIGDDNLRLGLHEFTHAYFLQARGAGSLSENSLTFYGERLLSLWRNEEIRQKIQAMGVIRDYAFENQMEFAAVIIEVYFESPQLLKIHLPFLHTLTAQMLNH